MFKKIILILIAIGVVGGVGFYIGQKAGFKNGINQAALNFSAAKRLEEKKALAQKPIGPNTDSMLRAVTGKWQSIRDASSVREFTASSTFTDYRNDKRTQSGTFSVFSVAKPDPEATFKLENGAAYFKIKAVNSEYADFYRINKITAADMELAAVEDGIVTQTNVVLKRIK